MNAYPRRRPAGQGRSLPQFHLSFGRAFNFTAGLLAIGLLFLVTGTVLAQMALPGDALYGWRVASERVWRLLHHDPLEVDLALARRHARDVTRVAGNAQAESLALRDYERALAPLSDYTGPKAQQTISESLRQQQAELAQARVNVPTLDKLLAVVKTQETALALSHTIRSIENGQITYSLTVTNQGPLSPATAVIKTTMSPLETLVSTDVANCSLSETGVLICTVDNLAVNRPRTLTLTTAVDRCYAGVITNTAVITGTGDIININAHNRVVAEGTISLPFPQPARVLYVQSSGRTHNLAMATSTGRILDLGLPAHSAAPAWSPDGQKIAFFGEEGISEVGGVYSQGNGVWVIDAAESGNPAPRQLVSQDHIKNIAWSPDGARLAFEVGLPDQTHEVVIIDANDGHEFNRFPGEQPAWRPDGQKLVIKSCAPGCGLWLVNPDGGGGQQITSGDSDSFPAWSPNGENLVFASERTGNWEIYRLRQADGQLLALTHRPATDTTPVFDACGQQIFLRTDYSGSWSLSVMKLDGSAERTVQENVGPSDDWGLARPAAY